MLKWIIFDAMGVVFTVRDDTNDLLVPYIQERNSAVARELINASYLRASLGRITSREFWDEVGLGAEYPGIETRYLDTMLKVDPAFMPVAQALKERYRLGLVSNDVGAWSAYLRKRHGLDFFSSAVISGDVGLRKPDPKIYQRFLEGAGARAKECLFIDDRVKNLAAARSVGMVTVLFDRDGSEDGRFTPEGRIGDFGELVPLVERLL